MCTLLPSHYCCYCVLKHLFDSRRLRKNSEVSSSEVRMRGGLNKNGVELKKLEEQFNLLRLDQTF